MGGGWRVRMETSGRVGLIEVDKRVEGMWYVDWVSVVSGKNLGKDILFY